MIATRAPVAARGAPAGPLRGRSAGLRGRLPLLGAAFGIIALLGVLYAGLSARSAGDALGVNATGAAVAVQPRPAPAISLATLDGGSFRLADQRGRLVVVNFWASWCAPCREEAAALERAWRDQGSERATGQVPGDGVVIVGVNLWDRQPAARHFLGQLGITYPAAVDAAGETAIAYGVRGLPETFFVDREGQIVRKWIGPLDERRLAATLMELSR